VFKASPIPCLKGNPLYQRYGLEVWLGIRSGNNPAIILKDCATRNFFNFERTAQMFREMRRKERQLNDTDSIEIISNGEFGILSTIGEDGFPCMAPLNYVYYNNGIYFHSATEGQKIDNIKGNNKVSFCIISDVELLPERFGTKYSSVIIFGKAIEAFDTEKEEALTALVKKYSSQYLERGQKYIQSSKDKTKVFKIEIEHMTGKSNRKP
jgi:uncharacterized protein